MIGKAAEAGTVIWREAVEGNTLASPKKGGGVVLSQQELSSAKSPEQFSSAHPGPSLLTMTVSTLNNSDEVAS